MRKRLHSVEDFAALLLSEVPQPGEPAEAEEEGEDWDDTDTALELERAQRFQL